MDNISNIAFTGINTGHPDEVLKDGACEDIYNLRFENGGLKEVYELTSIEQVNNTYSSIKGNWIILKPTFLPEHHYFYYEGPNVIGHVGGGLVAEAVAEVDGSGHNVLTKVKNVHTFPSIAESPLNPTDFEIMQYGNVIYITYGENEWTYLYKMGNYIRVNLENLPELTFKTDIRYYSLTDDNGHNMITSHTEYLTHANLKDCTEVQRVELTYQNDRPEIKEIINSYTTNVAEINALGYIVGEMKIALAYRLYDGSLIKASEPQFITSFLKHKTVKLGNNSLLSPYTIAAINAYNDDDDIHGAAFFDYLTGMIVKITDIPQSVIAAVDGDIITELVIIATKPTIPYDYSKCVYVAPNHFVDIHIPFRIFFRQYSSLSRNDILETEHYRKDKDIWYEVKKVDFDNLNTSCNLEYDTLKDIEHNAVVEPNYSHHTLTSQGKFDFNSRLHRWKTKNVLFQGYDLGIGSINSELYEVTRAKEYLRVKYGTTQTKPARTNDIELVSVSTNLDKFREATYRDRHGEEYTGWFPAFKFRSRVEIKPEDDVSIEVKYTFTRGSSSGEVTVTFEKVSFDAPASGQTWGAEKYLIDTDRARIATESEVRGSTVTWTIGQGQGATVHDTQHDVKYIFIYETPMYALITLRINNQFSVVRKNFTGWYFQLNGTTYYAVQNYCVYPDARATQIRFGKEGATAATNYLSGTYNFIQDEGNNQAFVWLNPDPVCDRADSAEYFENSGTPAPAYAFTLPLTNSTLPQTNQPLYENNKVYVSEENNPFYINPKNIYTIGQVSTEVFDLEASIEHLTETKFGYYPLYIFCNDGIYSLEQGNDIVYQSIQKVSGEVKLQDTGTVAVGTSVLFIGANGVMELSKRQAQCISRNLELYPALSRYDNTLFEFATYIQSARIYYNQQLREILVYNETKTYAYVYSIESQQWTRRAFRGHLIDGLRTFVRTDGVYDLWQENKSVPLSSARLYTRAIKLGTHEFKRIKRAILREKHDGPLQVGIRGTAYTATLQGCNTLNDLYGIASTWTTISTISMSADVNNTIFRYLPCSYKYYRLLVDITIDEYFAITGLDIESINRFVRHIR